MKHKLKWLTIAALLILITRFTLSSLPQNAPWHKESWQSLYTNLNLTIQGDSAKVQPLVRKLDVFFTDFTKNYQSGNALEKKLFHASVGDTVIVDSLSYVLLEFGEKAFEESKGKIQPGIGNLIRLWGLEWGQKPAVPSDSLIELEKAKLQYLFYKTLGDGKSIVVEKDSIKLALGAFSKGFALEYARHQIILAGFKNFLLEIGGDLVYGGHNPKGQEWSIGITDPNQKEGFIYVLKLPKEFNSMATSGGYQKFFTDSTGQKHHHILDPTTGRSTTGMKSATVLSQGGTLTDFLATWLFVEGFENAKAIDLEKGHFQTLLISPEDSVFVNPALKSQLVPLK